MRCRDRCVTDEYDSVIRRLEAAENKNLDQDNAIDAVEKAIPDLIELLPEKGEKGDKGEKGEKGDKGLTGAPGERGEKGEKGDKGDKGDTGEKGDKGDDGVSNIPGPKGDKGDKGDKGEPGEQGEKGDKGDKGDKGEKGDIGPEGPEGPQGEKGDIGPQGPEGPEGPQGEQGPPGVIENITVESIPGLPEALDDKQDKLIFLDEVIVGSYNVVRSRGIYDALFKKLDKDAHYAFVDYITDYASGIDDILTFDSKPVSGSNNIARSGGIYDALQAITYEIATEEEAIGGSNNTTLMTPLRVEQAFDEKFKVIDGVLNVYENGEWEQYEPK